MCSGTSSPGSATIPSGKRGNSERSRSDMLATLAPARRHEQVVEDGRRQEGLEGRLVDALEEEVAVEGVLTPEQRDVGLVGARFERAVEPSEPVGHELLAPDRNVCETRAARVPGEVSRSEGMDV